MSNARDIADAGHQLAAWVNFNGTFNDASGQSGIYACSGSTITITDTAHGLTVGDSIHAVFTRSAGDTTTITDDFFTVLTVPSVDTFTIQTVVATTDQSGSVAYDSDAATATAGSGPIRGSYNVSSIIDEASDGHFIICFETSMEDVNYSFQGSAYNATNTNVYHLTGFNGDPSVSQFYVYCYDFGGTAVNVKYNYASFYR